MYLDNTHGFKAIPQGYKQIFQNKFTNSISKNEIIKMKDEDILTNRDLEIALFLFDIRFATLEQIYEYLRLRGILTQKKPNETEEEVKETSINSIKARLDKLVVNRILNKFMLSIAELDKIQPDAMQIYCLDLGGKYLLSHYSSKDVTDWFTSTNLKASALISRDIATTQLYLRLLATSGDKLRYFVTSPLRKCDKTNILPTCEFCLIHNGIPNYYIVEVVREFDITLDFPQKIEKIERLVETNAWKKYYIGTNNPPVLFLLTESDMLALDAGRITTASTSIERFRITTDERINGDLSTAFMKYLKETDELKLTRANIF